MVYSPLAAILGEENRMKTLEGQVAIVTGGGTGIGRATAVMLAAEGAQVVIAGRRKPPLDEVVAEIETAGDRCVARVADVAKTADAALLARWTLEQYGRVDVLVNNAGHSSQVRNIRYVDEREWESVVAVNLTAVYKLTQAVLPNMIERGGGTVITVSSLAALRPGLIGGAPYGAAKAAARNLMGHVHTVLRNKGIRATTILPAEVDTPILDNRPLVPDAAARASMMQAEDVARAILLCVTMPARTVIEEVVMSPTILRDQSADIDVAARLGGSSGGAGRDRS
jgi:NADP-dependent 3-hydroxy acid dehydrogenase YdfG